MPYNLTFPAPPKLCPNKHNKRLLNNLCWLLLLAPNILQAQQYIGLGLHLSPPVSFDYPRNTHVVTRPQVGLAGSLTYKKEWAYRKRNKWYAETGLTFQSLRFYHVNYTGDSVTIWSDFENWHLGFPSVLLGGGHAFGLRRGAFSLGLEASFLIAQDFGGYSNSSFSLYHDPVEHATFPLHLRLNLAYTQHLSILQRFPGQLQVYANVSAQKLSQGEQTIRNVVAGGPTQTGNYQMNNTEIGLKFFAAWRGKRTENLKNRTPLESISTAEEQGVRYRVSIGSQGFIPARSVYHLPQVDSFSLKSSDYDLGFQCNALIEIPFRRNKLWGLVAGMGVGSTAATMVFNADGQFPADQQAIKLEKRIQIGYYALGSLGLSRRFFIGNWKMAHALAVTATVPIGKEYAYLGVPLSSADDQTPPYEQSILLGTVDVAYGREPVVFGLEYNPEVLISLPKPFFMAIGLVANYSRGVLAQGHFSVANQQTTYYGALLQRFSKIGLTIRLGLER